MNDDLPSPYPCASAGEIPASFMPSLVEVFLGAVRRSAPNKRRDCIDDGLEAFRGLLQFAENVKVTVNSFIRGSVHHSHRDGAKRHIQFSDCPPVRCGPSPYQIHSPFKAALVCITQSDKTVIDTPLVQQMATLLATLNVLPIIAKKHATFKPASTSYQSCLLFSLLTPASVSLAQETADFARSTASTR